MTGVLATHDLSRLFLRHKSTGRLVERSSLPFCVQKALSASDDFEDAEQHVLHGWVNIYENEDTGGRFFGCIFATKNDAEHGAKKGRKVIARVQVDIGFVNGEGVSS